MNLDQVMHDTIELPLDVHLPLSLCTPLKEIDLPGFCSVRISQTFLPRSEGSGIGS